MQVIKEIQNKRSLGATLNARYKKGMSLSTDVDTQTNLKSGVFPLFLCKGPHPTELLLRTSKQLGDNGRAVTEPADVTISQIKADQKRNKFVIVGGSIVAIVAIVFMYIFRRC